MLRGGQRVPLQRSAPPAGNIADGGRAPGPSLRRVAACVGRGYARFDDSPFPIPPCRLQSPGARVTSQRAPPSPRDGPTFNSPPSLRPISCPTPRPPPPPPTRPPPPPPPPTPTPP